MGVTQKYKVKSIDNRLNPYQSPKIMLYLGEKQSV